jgi:hypothetical protein
MGKQSLKNEENKLERCQILQPYCQKVVRALWGLPGNRRERDLSDIKTLFTNLKSCDNFLLYYFVFVYIYIYITAQPSADVLLP